MRSSALFLAAFVAACGTSPTVIDPPSIDVSEFRIEGAEPTLYALIDADIRAGTGPTAPILCGFRVIIDLRRDAPSMWIEIRLPFLGIGAYHIQIPITEEAGVDGV